MGFRLYIENDYSDGCVGKLYSYVDPINLKNNRYILNSMLYLCEIGVMDDYIEELAVDSTHYSKIELADMVFYSFSCVEIKLTYYQFKIFLLLYLMERYNFYCDSDFSISEVYADYFKFLDKYGNKEYINLEWS